MNVQALWEAVDPIVKKTISSAGYSTTFPNLTPIEFDGKVFTIGARHELYKNMVDSLYGDVIRRAVLEITGINCTVSVIITGQEQPTPLEERFKQLGVDTNDNLNPRFTFDDFVIGSNNDFACAAALAVAEAPSARYNPLLIYGGTGLGKTHLLHAVGNEVRRHHGNWRIVCTTAETFMNNFVDSIRNENNQEFRNKYRTIDCLLIDDIQFFAGKEGTQEEFFHTFNELIACNKQIMLTSDRPAKDIYPLEERLRTRLSGGLTVDIKSPDFETRLAIIKKKVAGEEFATRIPDEIYSLVAQQVKSNVRELEGALRTIVAYSQISRKEIDVKVANKILTDYFTYQEERRIDVNLIITEVERFYKLSAGSLTSKKRDKTYTYPRHVAIYITRELMGLSLPEIGQAYGGRDHTTVLHSIKKIRAEIDENVDALRLVNSLIETIKSAAI